MEIQQQLNVLIDKQAKIFTYSSPNILINALRWTKKGPPGPTKKNLGNGENRKESGAMPARRDSRTTKPFKQTTIGGAQWSFIKVTQAQAGK